MLRFLTAGESHGQALVVIVEGLPAGLPITVERDPGRAGPPPARLRPGPADALRGGRADPARRRPPRPHPRLAGRHRDRQHRVAQVGAGDVARARASTEQAADPAPARPRRPGRACRSTASPTPATSSSGPRPGRRRPGWRPGPCAKALLGPASGSRSSATSSSWARSWPSRPGDPTPDDLATVDDSQVRCFDPEAEAAMVAEIKAAAKVGDSLGGVVEVIGLRRAGRARQPRALGPQARRPAGPGADEHPGRQGRRDRRRLRRGRPAGLGGPRRHLLGRRSAGSYRRRTTLERRDRGRHVHRGADRGPGGHEAAGHPQPARPRRPWTWSPRRRRCRSRSAPTSPPCRPWAWWPRP